MSTMQVIQTTDEQSVVLFLCLRALSVAFLDIKFYLSNENGMIVLSSPDCPKDQLRDIVMFCKGVMNMAEMGILLNENSAVKG